MKMHSTLWLMFLLISVSVVSGPGSARADPCAGIPTAPVSQAFPTSGPEVTRWDINVCSVGNYGLVIGLTSFRTSPSSLPIQIFHDARVSEILVHYHNGTQFFDISQFSQGLMALGTVECPSSRGTRLLGNTVCSEVRDRGLAFKTDFSARRGEEVVLWGSFGPSTTST
jgi:hypothetical protein